MVYYFGNPFLGRVLLILLFDLACFAGASALAWHWLAPPFPAWLHATTTAVAALGVAGALYFVGAYDPTAFGDERRARSWLLPAMGLAFAAALFVYFVVPLPPGASDVMAYTAALCFPLLLVTRGVVRGLSASPRLNRRLIVLGTSDLAIAVADAVRARPLLGLELVGFLSDDDDEQGKRVAGFPVLGKLHMVEKMAELEDVDWIVVACKGRGDHFPADALLQAKLAGVRVSSGIDFFERITGRVYLRDLKPSYLIFSDGFSTGRIGRLAKRTTDILVSAIGLVLAAPLLVVCAAAIRAESKGAIFFRQTRLGPGKRTFEVIKLRSMREDAEAKTGPQLAHRDDDRITRVGAFLRRTRLDEVPQLWNVLRGDMSLVGPRPERPEFLDVLSESLGYFPTRFSVKPGVTGWAQVQYGYVNDLDGFEQKLALDLYYLKHRSLGLDLIILGKTLRTVLRMGGM